MRPTPRFGLLAAATAMLSTLLSAVGVLASHPATASTPVFGYGSPGFVVSAHSAPVDNGSYLVTLAPGPGSVPSVVDTLTSRYGGTVRFTYSHALRGFSVALPSSAAQALASDPLVARVEPNVAVGIADVQRHAPYGLDRIDQPNGLDGTYHQGATGAGVTAYILDTGIRPTHAEFAGRASVGYDAVGDGHKGIDCNGHGTHTAGTVGSTTYGVAKQVTLVGVRVLDCTGGGTADQVIAGLDWVAAHAVQPAVANMSIGATLSPTINAAVRGLYTAGVPIAVAAGNGVGNGIVNQDACTTSPASEPTAITVSAIDSTDTKPIWANYGTCVSLFAPGVDITSTWDTSDTATNVESGTSMASPHVAGAAALYLSLHPTATPYDVKYFLMSHATWGVVKNAGVGSPNLLLNVSHITRGSHAPTPSFSTSVSSLSVTATDTSTDSSGTIVSRAWSWGDGTSGTGTPVSHTYAADGTYTVTETVTDSNGATATMIDSLPVAAPTPDDPSVPALTSGVATSGTGTTSGTWYYYKIYANTGQNVALTLSGSTCAQFVCSPKFDLYGRTGAKPTDSTYTCAATLGAATQSCTVTNAPAGYVYVGVNFTAGLGNAPYTVRATVT